MRKMIAVAVLAALLVASSGAAHGATYYVDPAKGKADGDGTAAKPWRTLAEVASGGALRKVEPGDTVLLRSGNHGDVSISGRNAEVITIAAEAGQKPQLSRLTLDGEKWCIKGLTISPAFADKPYKENIVTFGEGGPSSDLVIEDCFIYTELDSSGWDPVKWKQAYNGVFMGRRGTKLTLRNNYILNTRFAISLCAEDSLCEGNVVNNFSADGIRITRDGQTVQYNVIKNNFCGSADGDDNHDDGIQCFLFNKGTGTVRRVTVVGNIIINREDDGVKYHNPLQAIGFFDGPLVDFVVTDNVVLVDMWHGVSLYSAQNCRIERNVAWSRWGTNRQPWIQLGGKGKGNTVKDNYACSYKISQPDAVASNNRKSDAKTYQQAQKRVHTIICEKFGKVHPVAGYPRLGPAKGTNPGPRQRTKARTPDVGAVPSKD